MRILVTNDDGIYAKGIESLVKGLKKFAQVTVVAPEGERSSVGHAITLADPIHFKRVSRDKKFFGYAVSGTTADCVKIGISVILKKKPDLVISGINQGDNDGCSVHYSGTVAGAREGALMGVPSMALSLATHSDADFKYSAQVSANLVKMLYKNRKDLPKGTFLNVNIPNIKSAQVKGIKVTRQGTIPIHGKFHKRVSPHTKEYYWMTGKFPPKKKNLEVDTSALHSQYVTVTPIKCDVTDHAFLENLGTWKI